VQLPTKHFQQEYLRLQKERSIEPLISPSLTDPVGKAKVEIIDFREESQLN
jgi:hypothetical protein